MFYPSKTQDTRNYGKPFFPDTITGKLMLNPVYAAVTFSSEVRFILDSGAFQDICKKRLSPIEAIHRQLRYIDKLNKKNDRDVYAESICIYDEMAGVDEMVINGKKVKIRGTEETAKRAVHETLLSAQAYNDNRNLLPTDRLMMIGQGVTPDQYVQCVSDMLPFIKPSDYFGFGGFCIIGRHRKKMLPIFYETFVRVLDILIPHGVQRFHTLGVCVPDAIKFAVNECKQRNVEFSTDSSAPEVASLIHGAVYIDGTVKYGTWKKEQKGIDYCPVDLAHKNIKHYHEWINAL